MTYLSKNKRLNDYIYEDIVPLHFWDHATVLGPLKHKCVFCLNEVSWELRQSHGYYITLEGLLPREAGDNTMQLTPGTVECTICLECSDYCVEHGKGLDEKPVEDYFGCREDFILKGEYPQNIINYSLGDKANAFCFLCGFNTLGSKPLIHYIPTGYYRNKLGESNLIPGPLLICAECEDEIDRFKGKSQYKWIEFYSLDTCCKCQDKHFISKAEEEYRIAKGTRGQYLCPECAIEENLMGKRRNIQPKCSHCERTMGNNKDILLKENYNLRIDNFLCPECENDNCIKFYVDKDKRIEVFKYTPNVWCWHIVQYSSTNPEEDIIIYRSKESYSRSDIAMYHAVIKAFTIINIQMTLNI